jgi:hypothetical protein
MNKYKVDEFVIRYIDSLDAQKHSKLTKSNPTISTPLKLGIKGSNPSPPA